MSNAQTQAPLKPEVNARKLIQTLGGAAMLSGFIIVSAYQVTLPRILENRRRAVEAAVFSVLPGATSRMTYALDNGHVKRVDETSLPGQRIYAGYDANDTLIGVAIEAAGQGYQDVIRVLYGYAPDRGCITGFTILESKETPGLGTKIGTEAKFIANFEALDVSLNSDGTSLAHPITTVKQGTKQSPWEIDGISGATVSSKAVGRILNDSSQQTLPIIQSNLDQIRTKK
jgi:electron transport complex protein RnfG